MPRRGREREISDIKKAPLLRRAALKIVLVKVIAREITARAPVPIFENLQFIPNTFKLNRFAKIVLFLGFQ